MKRTETRVATPTAGLANMGAARIPHDARNRRPITSDAETVLVTIAIKSDYRMGLNSHSVGKGGPSCRNV